MQNAENRVIFALTNPATLGDFDIFAFFKKRRKERRIKDLKLPSIGFEPTTYGLGSWPMRNGRQNRN